MAINVALIGNPNVGKTVIFNYLTGSRQHVGNWPGVTVEKKDGKCTYKGEEMNMVDLPGTYSLTASAVDEMIARNYIINEKPDVVVDIVDASNIERNLYLTLLLLELEANVVVALNMMDVATSKYQIDVDMLSRLLGVPVVSTVATKGEGMEELKEKIVMAAKGKDKRRFITIGYGEKIERQIKGVEEVISKDRDFLTNIL
ncbi:MAG: FeoB small GTPase domain-containing protein [Halobacteriota archaeon]|nr:FeoB small GTPase domain-containing protein [Halobacteriota archaeon]